MAGEFIGSAPVPVTVIVAFSILAGIVNEYQTTLSSAAGQPAMVSLSAQLLVCPVSVPPPDGRAVSLTQSSLVGMTPSEVTVTVPLGPVRSQYVVAELVI